MMTNHLERKNYIDAHSSNNTNRICYLDGLRGFAMLLVIYGHVASLAFTPTDGNYSIISKLCASVQMPIFFFISGFFAYKSIFHKRDYRSKTINISVRTLFPTFIIGAIYCLSCTNLGLTGMWFNMYKGGYWFTIVYAEMFFIGAPLLYLFIKDNVSRRRQVSVLFLLGVLSYTISLLGKHYGLVDNPVWLFFSVDLLTKYLLFFFGGCIFGIMYKSLIINVLSGGVFLHLLHIVDPVIHFDKRVFITDCDIHFRHSLVRFTGCIIPFL